MVCRWGPNKCSFSPKVLTEDLSNWLRQTYPFYQRNLSCLFPFPPPPKFVMPVSNHFLLRAIDVPRLLKLIHISSDSWGWVGTSSSVHSLLLSYALEDKMRHPGQTGISYFCLSSAKSALSEYSRDSHTLLTQKKNVLGITMDKAKHQPWKQVKTLLVFSGFNPRANPVQNCYHQASL